MGAADPRHEENLGERVEKALRGAALWDEVKDRLKQSALGLSGGQQQRLCIARSIAIEPDVLLLDEPASALDPISTASIEELMHSLKRDYTLVIVTHNMQQAARVAERTAFFSLDVSEGRRTGILVEYDNTEKLFTRPRTSAPRTTSPGASAERPSPGARSPRQQRPVLDRQRLLGVDLDGAAHHDAGAERHVAAHEQALGVPQRRRPGGEARLEIVEHPVMALIELDVGERVGGRHDLEVVGQLVGV